MDTTYLPAWHVLTVTPSADALGDISLFTHPGTNPVGVADLLNGAVVTIGPYVTDELVGITATQGSFTTSTARFDIAALASDLAAHKASRTVQDFSGAGTPVDYTDGDPAATGEGVAAIGARYTDTTAGKVYVNGGTLTQPVWKIVTSAT